MGDKVLSDAQKETSYFVPNDKIAETILHTIVRNAIMTAMTPFVGEEVTGKSEYYNSNIHLLAKR